MGIAARSWQGWQVPILTSDAHGSARIASHRRRTPRRGLRARRGGGVAGFQGVHEATGRITTLGRGGSDTSAVAVAAAIDAERCDIYTDVDGVYTTDPRIVPKARQLDKVSFEEMLEMASLGAKVLQVRSVELAMVHKVATYRALLLRRSGRPAARNAHLRRGGDRGTAGRHRHRLSPRTRRRSRCGASPTSRAWRRRIFVPLADANINVDMIIQVVSEAAIATTTTDITFTVPTADYERACAILAARKDEIGYEALQGATDVVKVSAIGVGMRSHAGVAARAFRALADKGINIRAITTSARSSSRC